MRPELLTKMGVPKRYLKCSRSSWEPVPSGDPWESLDSWLRNPNRTWVVVLLGRAGCGKTHLATALAVAMGGSFWWIDAATAMNDMRDEIHRDPATPGVTMREKLRDPRLLVIDDWLADRLTDFAHDEWVCSLSHRYNSIFPTIITSNAESLEAFDALDPRITSRLSSGLVIRLSGKDRRGLKSVRGATE